MRSLLFTRFVVVVAVLGGIAVTSEAHFFHRARPCPCPVIDPNGPKSKTVSRLATRVRDLDEMIDKLTPADFATPAAANATKARLRAQIALIGVVGGRNFNDPLPPDADAPLPNTLDPDEVRRVGGEIGTVRQNLRRAQELPPD